MWKQLSVDWRSGVEIAILAVLLYYGYRFFRATRGARILTGLLMLLMGLTLVAQLLELEVINSLIQSFSVFFALGLTFWVGYTIATIQVEPYQEPEPPASGPGAEAASDAKRA